MEHYDQITEHQRQKQFLKHRYKENDKNAHQILVRNHVIKKTMQWHLNMLKGKKKNGQCRIFYLLSFLDKYVFRENYEKINCIIKNTKGSEQYAAS